MPDYSNKYLDSVGVKHLWDKGKAIYQRKEPGKGLSSNDFTTSEKNKLAGLQNYELPAASNNNLGGIKIGEGLVIDQNGVVRTVYNPVMDVEWDNITGQPTTLDGYGIIDAATKTDLQEIQTSISSVYKYKGRVQTLNDLANMQNPQNGDVYDVIDTGMNYCFNADESRWDSLGGSVSVNSLSNDEIDAILDS